MSYLVKTTPIPRRTFLRGVGTVMALPFLEAMMPRSVRAAAHRSIVASNVDFSKTANQRMSGTIWVDREFG